MNKNRKTNKEKIKEDKLFLTQTNKRRQQRSWHNRVGRFNSKNRIHRSIGEQIRQSLKGIKNGRRWHDLLGYTTEELIKHLESLFDENMNWSNYGSYWHLDHKKPKSLFKFIIAEDPEFKKCWALENLQPMEKMANLKKGANYKEDKKVGEIK